MAPGDTTLAAPKPPKPWYRRGLHSAGFDSPTGNIRCAIQTGDDTQLLCTTLNNGNGVDLDNLLAINTNWTVTIPAGNPTLAYGKGWWSRYFYCWSQADATYCRSLYSRHGLKIDRAGIYDWIWPKAILLFVASSGGGVIPGGSGSPVMCNDGTLSYSGGIQGACSWHGGEAG